MEDYTTDTRGDVGSWVREASICAFRSIVPVVVSSKANAIWPEHLSDLVVASVMRQSVERIDKLRYVAGTTLREWLYASEDVTGILRLKCPDLLQQAIHR